MWELPSEARELLCSDPAFPGPPFLAQAPLLPLAAGHTFYIVITWKTRLLVPVYMRVAPLTFSP